MHRFSSKLGGLVVVVALAVLASCRDEAPPPAFMENLGTDARLLAPVHPTSYHMSDKLLSGRAEIKPLKFDRKPGEATEEPQPDESADGSSQPSTTAAPDSGSASALNAPMPTLPQ